MPEVEDFVAAVYKDDGKSYIGKVSEVDEDEEEAELSFMITQLKRQVQMAIKTTYYLGLL